MAIPRPPKKRYLILAAPFIAGAVLAFLFLAFPLSIALGALFAFVAFGSLAKYLYDMWKYEYKAIDREILNAINKEMEKLMGDHNAKTTLFPNPIADVTKDSAAYYPTQFLDMQLRDLGNHNNNSTVLTEKIILATAIFIKEIRCLKLYESYDLPDSFHLNSLQGGTYSSLLSTSSNQYMERAMRQRFLLHLIFLRLVINKPKKESKDQYDGDFLIEPSRTGSDPLAQSDAELQVGLITRLLQAPKDEESREESKGSQKNKLRINILEKFNPAYSKTGATSIFELALQSGRIPHLRALVDDLLNSDKYTFLELYDAYETLTDPSYGDVVSNLGGMINDDDDEDEAGQTVANALKDKIIILINKSQISDYTFLELCKAYQIMQELYPRKGNMQTITAKAIQKLEEKFPPISGSNLSIHPDCRKTLDSAMLILNPNNFSVDEDSFAGYVQYQIGRIDAYHQSLELTSTPQRKSSSRCCPCSFWGGNSREARVAPHPSPAPTGQHSVQRVDL